MNPRLTTVRPASELKPGDPPGEGARRAQALELLRDAIENEARVRADAARACQERAEQASWLGASLADLATVTGRSRQAARKRWPSLGPISERRRWLGNHVDDILGVARLVLQHDTELDPGHRTALSEQFTTVCAKLADDTGTGTDPALRWRLLDELVDTHLRRAGDRARGAAGTDEAQFARDGAHGVVAYYDHAARRTSSPT